LIPELRDRDAGLPEVLPQVPYGRPFLSSGGPFFGPIDAAIVRLAAADDLGNTRRELLSVITILATFRRKKPFSDDRATNLGARTRRQVAADKL
jgi:hypothetical protein